MKKVFFLIFIALFFSAAAEEHELYQTSGKVPPNVVILFDVSGSMGWCVDELTGEVRCDDQKSAYGAARANCGGLDGTGCPVNFPGSVSRLEYMKKVITGGFEKDGSYQNGLLDNFEDILKNNDSVNIMVSRFSDNSRGFNGPESERICVKGKRKDTHIRPAGVAPGSYSSYFSNVYFRGSQNGWVDVEMDLFSSNLRQIIVYLNQYDEFKIKAVNSGWEGWYPRAGTDDNLYSGGEVDGDSNVKFNYGNGNISVQSSGTYRISFNEDDDKRAASNNPYDYHGKKVRVQKVSDKNEELCCTIKWIGDMYQCVSDENCVKEECTFWDYRNLEHGAACYNFNESSNYQNANPSCTTSDGKWFASLDPEKDSDYDLKIDRIKDMFNAMEYDGNTPTGSALLDLWDFFHRNNHYLRRCRENVVILITDGLPTRDEPYAQLTDQIGKHNGKAYSEAFANFLVAEDIVLPLQDSDKRYAHQHSSHIHAGFDPIYFMYYTSDYLYKNYCGDKDGQCNHEYYDYHPKASEGYRYTTPHKATLVASYIYDQHFNKDIDQKYRTPLYHSAHKHDKAYFKNDGVYGAGQKRCVNDDGTACKGDKIRVYPISIFDDLSSLKETARLAGGEYFTADKVDELTEAVACSIYPVRNRPEDVFVSAPPAVSLSGKRHENYVYIPSFAVSDKGHWWGTISKGCLFNGNGENKDDSENCIFKNETDSKDFYVPSEKPEEKYTGIELSSENQTNTENGFIIGTNAAAKKNIGNRDVYYLAGTTLTAWNESGEMTEFIQGKEREVVFNGSSNCKGTFTGNWLERKNPLGDFWHSSPYYFKYNGKKYVIAGSNSGFLHLFDDENEGKELKAIIPSEELKARHENMVFEAAGDRKSSSYGVDLTPKRLHTGSSDGEKDWVAVGYRRGGVGYTFIKTSALTGSLNGTDAVRWKDALGQSWEAPEIHTVSSGDHIIAPYGYDSFFDRDDEKAADYIGADSHGVAASFGESIGAPVFLKPSGVSKRYPVLGAFYPISLTGSVDSDPTTLTSDSSDMFYYSDIIGNIFAAKSDFSESGIVFEFAGKDKVSGQEISSFDTGVKNKDLLKVFGAVKSVIRNEHTDDPLIAEDDGHNKEMWIFYGTGDLTRVTR